MKLELLIRKIKDNLHKGEYYLEKYIINDGKKHPVAIICPGGAYRFVASFVEGLPYARWLNKRGYSAFVVHYACGKNAGYPAPQLDVVRAIKEIAAHSEEWNLDMEGYSLWGASAGGHLAASFGTKAMGYELYDVPKPGAIILTYPVISMVEKTHPLSRELLLGKNPAPDMIELASVEKQVTADYPPTFIWCGLADQVVDPDNSRMMADALKAAAVPHRFVRYENVGHGVGLGEDFPCESWIEKAVEFWEEQRNK